MEYTVSAAQDAESNDEVKVGDRVDRNLLEERETALIEVGTQGVRTALVQVQKAAHKGDINSLSTGDS